MSTNWPPLSGTYPDWPPPELGSGYAASDWQTLARELIELGFTHAAPTADEPNLYFPDSVTCGDGHQVIGRMLVSPDGLRRYPFCCCLDSAHRELLVLFWPFTCGGMSGPVSF